MAHHRKFEPQLENFRHEAEYIARYVYADMAVQHAASRSDRLLGRLNETPLFWITSSAGFQLAGYISLGRVFDQGARYTIDNMVGSFERNLQLFSRSKLAERKRDGKTSDPEWLAEYLERAHYPTAKDVEFLREKVAKYRAIYERSIKPVRDKYLAHREKIDHTEVTELFAGGTKRELWRLSSFLVQFHDVLWEQLHNGRKPKFRSIRYSPKSIYDSSSEGGMLHERIVAEVRVLMERLAK